MLYLISLQLMFLLFHVVYEISGFDGNVLNTSLYFLLNISWSFPSHKMLISTA
jgi:hypothetical protein